MKRSAVLFFLQFRQDWDLVFPVVRRMTEKGRLVPKIMLTRDLHQRAPQLAGSFKVFGIDCRFISRFSLLLGLGPSLQNIGAVFTASESSAAPHRAAYNLTQLANKKGLMTYTVQHGFENIGLTYFDRKYPPSMIKFSSKKVLIWGALEQLDPRVPADIRARCLPVGCPKDIEAASPVFQRPETCKSLVAVFENLHWHRYDKSYKLRFLKELSEAAQRSPDIFFLVKPHYDESWLISERRKALSGLRNVAVVDVHDPAWIDFTAPAVLSMADAVITTPSTIALDAARAGAAVAVIADQGKMDTYEPLTLLGSSDDWTNFVRAAGDRKECEKFQTRSRTFVEQRLVTGDAVERIVSILQDDLAEKE